MSDVDTAKVVADLDNDPRVTVNEDGRKTVTPSTPVEVRGEKVLKSDLPSTKGPRLAGNGQGGRGTRKGVSGLRRRCQIYRCLCLTKWMGPTPCCA